MLLSIDEFTAGGATQVSPRRVLAAAGDAAATAGETCSALTVDDGTATDTPTQARHVSRGEGPWA